MNRLLAALIMAPVQAGAFSMEFPVDCTLNDTCFIQQFMDRDPTGGVSDFTCGPLSYDGHKGTDIALPTLRAMQGGVTVRAAAAGVVKGVRDGMPDISRRDPAAPPLAGRDCGNGVVIDHGDGWETQYCHMARGSMRHKAGDQIATGDTLGLIGLSGNTEFPHLHISVRKDGAEVDPFDPDGTTACGEGPVPALWADPIAYTPGGLIGAGFADHVPQWEAVKAGLAQPPLAPTAPALVLWAQYFGLRQGDGLRFHISGPQGTVLEETVSVDRQQAQGFRAVGKTLRAPNWAAGTYEGRITLIRAGSEIDQISTTLTISR